MKWINIYLLKYFLFGILEFLIFTPWGQISSLHDKLVHPPLSKISNSLYKLVLPLDEKLIIPPIK